MVRGKGIEDREEAEVMQSEIRRMSGEAGIKGRGNEDVEGWVYPEADLIACRNRGKILSSFAVDNRRNQRGSEGGKDGFLGNKPVGEV